MIDYMSLDIEGYERVAMEQFPFHTHAISIVTVERPGKVLHRRLVDRGMCVSHNAAGWTDLLYVNRTLWRQPISVPPACSSAHATPEYVAPSDRC